ncbi:hypothetical protein [Natronosalvus vescus]|uniref:hypothetical protein n=1 Tax=Natronosalvus vescus TaxID=2953881 RepID=UPI002091824D|nr:hypothetical protein [Natronosalvus vescus]
MKRRRFIVGTAAASIGGSALLGSGAYSTAKSQREVRIRVEGDEDAYLSLKYADVEPVIECTHTVDLITITNQLKAAITALDVELDVSNDDVRVGGLTYPDTLGIGESGVVSVDVDCTASNVRTTTITFGVEAAGEEFSVETDRDRQIEVSCECPCESETAWVDGEPYSSDGTGSWATYTPWVDGSTHDLLAGQTSKAGTVTFDDSSDGVVEIGIDFHDGWSLQDGEEAIKIQGYDEAPSGNPAPGLFSTYKGRETGVSVERYPYYGIHVDAEYCGSN